MKKLVIILFLGLLAFAGFTRWQNLSEEPLIMTDGQGYYAYLPAVIIYQDLQFSFVDSLNQRYYPEDKRAKFINETPHGNVNKYFAGTAVLEAPFFLTGCVLAAGVGEPVDGYSWPFQLMIGLAALVYSVLGLYLLSQFLIAIGMKEKAVMLTAFLMLFGTNLLYYSIYEPSMSHAYSFFTISAFLYFTTKAYQKGKTASFVLAAVALGLTVLIRPTNAMVLLGVPVLTSGVTGLMELIKSFLGNKKAIVMAVLAAVLVVSIQPLFYLLQTGAPMVWSYEGEGFNFLHPEFSNVLFSYRKGLFVYSPLILLSLVGLASLYFINKSKAVWLLLAVGVSTWVISSWWMWYYGGSFGHRAFIDYYPFFAIGLAALLTSGLGFLKPGVFAVIGLLLVPIQLIQTYQYNMHIITFDNMSKTKYWNLFLRTGDDLAWYYSGYEGQDSYVGIDSVLVKHSMESELGWGNENQLIDDPIGEGKVARMGADDQYGLTFRKQVSEIEIPLNTVRISSWTNSNARGSDISFVCSLEDSTGAGYYWQKYPLRPQINGTGNWSWTSALFRCGAPRNAADKFVIYPMKSDGSSVLLDDLEISFIQAK